MDRQDLTDAQRSTLKELDDAYPKSVTYASHYPPIERLIELGFVDEIGFAEGVRPRFGSAYRINSAGRAALARSQPETEQR